MTRARLLIVAIAVAAIVCLAIVLSEQYASGNIYAEYSSQRTDRMGTAALYEALAKVYPEVSRNEIPLHSLTVKNSDVLILGESPEDLDGENRAVIESLLKGGNRIVIALDGGSYMVDGDLAKVNKALEARWHVRLVDPRKEEQQDNPRNTFQFEPARGWAWKAEGAGLAREFGGGSVVLLGTSWPFTNQALREDRNTDAITAALGHSSRILFDETHLGTAEQGTVMGLVRRFRLQGVVAVALACALLFIWQTSAPFPQERAAPVDADMRLVAASASEGLRNLLAHHIPAGRVVAACVAEWRKDRGRLVAPDKLARIESIAAGKAHPAEQWREIRAALDIKRKPK